MKIIILIPALVLSAAVLCSCGSQPTEPVEEETGTLETFLDSGSQLAFSDLGDVAVWDRDVGEIVSQVAESVSSQTVFPEEYTLNISPANNAYYLQCGGSQTSCRVSFQSDSDGMLNRIRVFSDSMKPQDLESYVVLSSAVLNVIFSDVASFDQGTSAFSGIYFGESENESASSSDGFSAVTRFEPTESSLSLTVSKISTADLEKRHTTVTYSESEETFRKTSYQSETQSEQPKASSAPASSSAPTLGQQNALRAAKDYVDMTGFSYTGLIGQLEYEGYSHEESVYGADNCGADWNAEAAESAKDYMDMTAFSRQGLIDQLLYEGFTKEQAEYGAASVGY